MHENGGIEIPPRDDINTFNENDILGNLDKTEKGKVQPIALPSGDKVDKEGRLVNDKGYLVDEDGNILDGKTNKKMFDQKETDINGDLPAPFKW